MTLASIQRITSVEPILKADRIEKVRVLGWDCVVKKGEFKPGDLCIYIEIDSLIPLNLLSGKDEDKETYHRLRTVKMKGQLSQGLVLPISLVDGFLSWNGNYYYRGIDDADTFTMNIGDDVTEKLNIKKYEKTIPPQLQGLTYGTFPSFLSKTDEVRIQSEPDLLDKLKGMPYYITTKLDGTSATYYKFEGHFGVCSRNLELKDGDNIYWQMARKYNLEEIIPDGYCLQGEICGPGIQKNPLELPECDLFIFNIYIIKGNIRLDTFLYDYYSNIPKGALNLVPIEESEYYFNYTLEELLKKASSAPKKEGIVVRSLDQSISFKVLNNNYLLMEED